MALLGVDFLSDQTEVDARRSPDMVNMISDFGGNPVKRDGYRRVGERVSSIVVVDNVIYGIYVGSSSMEVDIIELENGELVKKEEHVFAHDVGKVNQAFASQKNIYIVTANCLVCYDTIEKTFKSVGIGEGMMSVEDVGESAPAFEDNIPDTVITLNPDGTGGVVLDDKNIFSIYQRYSYVGNGTSTEFTIPNYKKIGNWVKAEVMNEDGDWEEVTVTLGESSEVTGRTLDGTDTMTSNVVDPVVTFSEAPAAPAVTGEDSVRITFAPYSMDEVETDVYKGFYNEAIVNLLSNDVGTFQDGRLFIAEKYKVYYSNTSDPFTISDLAWFDVDSEVICFTRSSNYLVVITKNNDRNTIFLADETSRVVDSTAGTTETYFAIKPSNAGIGGIATKGIATLSDEPIFLSTTGLFGIQTNWQSEKYVINRSSRVDKKLCREPNLQNAVSAAFNGYYYLAINGHMYILDSRHRESDRSGNKPMEAYYFEGMPDIDSMYVVDDRMYFTDEDGTYTWNDDLDGVERYYDNAVYKTVAWVSYQVGESAVDAPTGEWQVAEPEVPEGMYLWYLLQYDDYTTEVLCQEEVGTISNGDRICHGTPVRCRWCSTFDDDGAPQRLKTLMKKGTMISVVPHFRSGCEITLIKDGNTYEYLGSFDFDLNTFEYIDFTRFSFESNSVALDAFTKKKIKKYKRLQIRVENNKAEPFGLTQITKTYTLGNFAKR
jgi:hypothetical protein